VGDHFAGGNAGASTGDGFAAKSGSALSAE
jgi:hypothetical protein